MNKRLILVFILFLFGVSACSTKGANLPRTYPAPLTGSSNPTGYPVNSVEEIPAIPTVTSDPQLGSVQGKILYKGKPLSSKLLYLAGVLKDTNSNMDIATTLDVNTAPRAVTNEDGSFEFFNIKPGHYGLILYEGTSTYLMLHPETNKAIIMDVLEKKNVDLGKMDFQDLPLE